MFLFLKREAFINRKTERSFIAYAGSKFKFAEEIYHKGSYANIGEAYAFLMKYADQNGYTVAGLARECYIDGIWNKESEEEWLTEIQLPIEDVTK